MTWHGWESEGEKADRRLMAAMLTGIVLFVIAAFMCGEIGDRPAVEVPLPVATEPHSFHAESRGPGWGKARAAHLATHPACEVCGERVAVEVHHYESVSRRPDLLLSPENLVTLCHRDHRYFGHLGNYRCQNSELRQWIKAIKERKEE